MRCIFFFVRLARVQEGLTPSCIRSLLRLTAYFRDLTVATEPRSIAYHVLPPGEPCGRELIVLLQGNKHCAVGSIGVPVLLCSAGCNAAKVTPRLLSMFHFSWFTHIATPRQSTAFYIVAVTPVEP